MRVGYGEARARTANLPASPDARAATESDAADWPPGGVGEPVSEFEIVDVPAEFDRAAATYDKMVNLNPGYHRHLQSAADALVEKLPPGPGQIVVDLGCGSGASTDALVNSMGHRGHAYTAVGIDGSAGMLDEARSKPWPTWVTFAQGRAEDLPALAATVPALRGTRAQAGGVQRSGPTSSGPTSSAPTSSSSRSKRAEEAAEAETGAGSQVGSTGVAGVLAAYLFRNVSDRDAVLRSVWDLLAPGGVLVAQDYSVSGSPSARRRWSAVSWSVVIPLSKVINHDTGLYRYLWRSVLDNDPVDGFCDRMLAAGFVDVEHRTVGGWQRGILHTFRGRKPA